MTHENILQQVRNKFEEGFEIAESFYGEKIPRAEIKFDLIGATAGTSCYAKRLFRINRVLLQENAQEFLNHVCYHELAHHVCRWRHGYAGIKSHGKEWRKICVEVFKISTKVKHSFNVEKTKRKTKEYVVTCGCPNKKYYMGKIKFNRMRRNSGVCAHCLQQFSFDGRLGGKLPNILKETCLDWVKKTWKKHLRLREMSATICFPR